MERRELVAVLASYLPDVVVRRLGRSAAAPDEPLADRFNGAVLVADLSGFTAMSAAFARHGALGPEMLGATLNSFFDRVIAIITSHGGDIVRFAGDAVLTVWRAEDDRALSDVAARAAHCALALRDQLHGYRTDGKGTPLALRMGVGAAEIVILHLGGERQRRELLVAGPAFVQAFTALDKADAGQAVVSLRAWSHIQAKFVGQQLSMGSVLVERSQTPATLHAEPLPALCDDLAAAVQRYIPAAVCARLSAGHEEWLGELRVVSVLFVNLPELNYATPLERANEIMCALQSELYRFEGSINKLNVDEKGTALLAGLGLPPLAHEDDAKRAVHAALAIQRRLGAMGARTSIGIATGRVFCGTLGNSRRREYTILGDVVNISARLMQAALGDIFCDGATYHAVRAKIAFERLPDIALKGRDEPVAVYRPLESRPSAKSDCHAFVGRRDDCDTLDRLLRGLVAGAETAVVIFEGEAGMGKSRLVGEVLDHAGALGVRSLVGAGDSVEAGTLYYAWRAVFNQILDGAADDLSPAARRQRILTHLSAHENWLQRAPLLEAVVPCGLEDNEITGRMTGQVRGDNTRELLLEILGEAVGQTPTLLVIDDAHWLDSASWTLVTMVSQRLPSVLLLLATRPFTQNSAADYNGLLGAANTTLIRLEKLSVADTAQLAAHCLGVASVPDEIAALVHEKAEGNPLFAEELVRALHEGRLLEVVGGQCRLTANLADASAWGFPDTLHGVIASRIDRLGAPQQLAVKVASVIGQSFRFRALHDNYPLESEKGELRGHLAIAQQAGLIALESPEPEPAYLFRHAIMQQVAYELLLYQQRQQLHQAVATWYERYYAENLAEYYPFLAHHWRHAGDAVKAADYLEKAGEQSLRSGAYREAAGFFGQLLSLPAEADLFEDEFRRACWLRRLGEANAGLGKLTESRGDLLRALDLLDRRPPPTATRLNGALLLHAWRQAWRGVLRSVHWPTTHNQPLADVSREVALAYERLAEIYYLCGERARVIHALLCALNYAENAGPSALLARAYASSAAAADVVGLSRLARVYRRAALSTARRVGGPPAVPWVWAGIGLAALGRGDAAEAIRMLHKALAVYRHLGDWQHWGECMAMCAQANYCLGQVERGVEFWRELFAVARTRGDRLQQAWGLNGQAEGLLRCGTQEQTAEAITLLRAALGLFTENIDKISVLTSYGLLATAYLRQGDAPAARRAADDGMRLIEGAATPMSYYVLGGYAGVADAYLALWESGPAETRDALAEQAAAACRGLARFARALPLGSPTAWRCQGSLAWLCGRKRAAFNAWRQASVIAARLRLPHDEGLAEFEWGRHLPLDDSQRRGHLDRAGELFSAVNAHYDLKRLDALRSATT